MRFSVSAVLVIGIIALLHITQRDGDDRAGERIDNLFWTGMETHDIQRRLKNYLYFDRSRGYPRFNSSLPFQWMRLLLFDFFTIADPSC
jgi:hypothetical protein